MEKQAGNLSYRAAIGGLTAVLFTLFSTTHSVAQDDDEIFGTRNPVPKYEDVYDDNSTGTDGYSTYEEEDYYDEGYVADSLQKMYSEEYVDENGNTVINNYYNNDDYYYSSRIRRFHRPMWGMGYYDPWYTDMYWYNYDPFFWGTSIYAGAWPSWTSRRRPS